MRLSLKSLLPDLPRLREDPLGFLQALAQRGDRFVLPRPPVAFLFDPEGVEKALLEAKTSKKTFQYRGLSRVTGKGLLTDDGEGWKKARLALKDPFLPRAMPALRPLLEEEAEAFFSGWRPGKRELEREMLALSLRFLGRAYFGGPLPEEVAEASLRALTQVVAAAKTPWLLLSPAHRAALARERKWLLGQAASLLARFPPLKALPEERAMAEAVTLLIAGHETTASALSWSLYLLTKHPVHIPRLLEGEEYALWTFQEALRLYPPAWVITRRLEAPLALAGLRLPPGTLLVLSPFATHRTRFQDPLAFWPERFRKMPRPGAYFPFGLGGRTCLGKDFALLEGVVALRALFARYRLELLEEPGLEAGVTLRPKGGLWAVVREAG